MKKGILFFVGCTLLVIVLIEFLDLLALNQIQEKTLHFCNFLFIAFITYYKRKDKIL